MKEKQTTVKEAFSMVNIKNIDVEFALQDCRIIEALTNGVDRVAFSYRISFTEALNRVIIQITDGLITLHEAIRGCIYRNPHMIIR